MTSNDTLCHCGQTAKRQELPDPWDGRLDGYCDACAIARCDAYPGECPNLINGSVSKTVFTIVSFIASASGITKAAPKDLRCMGKRCPRLAEYEVKAIDETMGAHEYPIKLCRSCLCAISPNGSPVDIFRWLSDNRIEADA